MFDRFTKSSRLAVALANHEAARYSRNWIGDLELLLGILKEAKGIGGLLFELLGVERIAIIEHIERDFSVPAKEVASAPQLPQTPEFRQAVETATGLSVEWNDKHVGTEHLLLALLQHSDSRASTLLASHGVTFDRAHHTLLEVTRAAM